MHQEKRPQKALARIQGGPLAPQIRGMVYFFASPGEPGSIPMWKASPLIVRATAIATPLAPTATTFT